MLAIITGTICPSGDMKQLAICNAEERLEQYKKDGEDPGLEQLLFDYGR